MEDYSFKQISRENLKDILSIFFESFGKKVDEHYLLKKSTTAPIGKDFICFAAYHNKSNKVAAFLALYPCLIHHKGQFIWAAQEGDGMVSAEHQGKGLFIQLIKLTMEYAEKEGVKIIFGFPNHKSYPAFIKKLNWLHYEDLHSYLVRIRCLPWIRLKQWFGLSDVLFERYTALIMRFFRNGNIPFENSIDSEEHACVYRQKEYFEYKTFEKNYVKKICGKSLWLKPDINYLKIGDMERCTEKKFKKIIRKLKWMGFFLGTHHIRYTCSPGVYFESFFADAGRKLETSYPIILLDINSGIDLKKLKFTMCDNDTF